MRALRSWVGFSFLLFVCITVLTGCTSTGKPAFKLPDLSELGKRPLFNDSAPVPGGAAQSAADGANQDRAGGASAPLPLAKNLGTQKVALLVPLSGRANEVGEGMLNAAQLAMSDLGGNQFELMPRDTAGTPEIARNVATKAIDDGAGLILGPLFAEDTKAVAPVAAQRGVNVVSFSTDSSATASNSFVMGFLPQSQVARVVDFAITSGQKNIVLITSRDAYGDTVASAFNLILQNRGLMPAAIVRFSGAKPSVQDLAVLKNKTIDAVVIATAGQVANTVSVALNGMGISSKIAPRYGTGLWDDPAVAALPELQGAFYAASSPTSRARFEDKYRAAYGVAPPRLASLGYDAAALAIVLSKNGHGFGRDALLNPNGFSGVDGIFRFRNDGLNERGLAVMKIDNGRSSVVRDAPRTFMQ